MKMSPETFAALSAAITPELIHRLRCTAVAAHSPELLRWNVLWTSGFPVAELCNQGLSDAHIDTALRCIIPDQ